MVEKLKYKEREEQRIDSVDTRVISTLRLSNGDSHVKEMLPKFKDALTKNKLYSIFEIMDVSIIHNHIEEISSAIGRFIINLIPQTISYIPGFILNIFITFFVAYYILIDWDKFEKIVLDIIPFKNKHEIIKKIKKDLNEIVRGTFWIALIELIVTGIVLWLLGIQSYLIIAVLIAVFAFIPALGPALIWIPLVIIELILGEFFIAGGILILGLILSVGIDHLLRIKILGKRTGMHPVIMLLGIIGGVQLLGIMGLLLGPIILSILLAIIENIPSSK